MNAKRQRNLEAKIDYSRDIIKLPKIKQSLIDVLDKDSLSKVVKYLIVREQAKLGDKGSIELINGIPAIFKNLIEANIEFELV